MYVTAKGSLQYEEPRCTESQQLSTFKLNRVKHQLITAALVPQSYAFNHLYYWKECKRITAVSANIPVYQKWSTGCLFSGHCLLCLVPFWVECKKTLCNWPRDDGCPYKALSFWVQSSVLRYVSETRPRGPRYCCVSDGGYLLFLLSGLWQPSEAQRSNVAYSFYLNVQLLWPVDVLSYACVFTQWWLLELSQQHQGSGWYMSVCRSKARRGLGWTGRFSFDRRTPCGAFTAPPRV